MSNADDFPNFSGFVQGVRHSVRGSQQEKLLLKNRIAQLHKKPGRAKFLFLPFSAGRRNIRSARGEETLYWALIGVSTGQREIIAYKSLDNKKEPNRNDIRFRLFLLYEVLCNDFRPLTPPRRPCYHSPNEKSKKLKPGDCTGKNFIV